MSVRTDYTNGNRWQADSKDVRHTHTKQTGKHVHSTGSHIERKVAEFQQQQSGKHSETREKYKIRDEAKQVLTRDGTQNRAVITADEFMAQLLAREAK